MNLTFVLGNNPTLRVNEHQCRPGTNRILSPDAHTPIIHYRMTNTIAQHRIAYAIGELLAWKLRRMDTHHRQFVGEGHFKLAQLRECMHTIYSAQRPEVQNQDAPPELPNMQWMVAIDPIQPARKVRRSDFSSKLRCH